MQHIHLWRIDGIHLGQQSRQPGLSEQQRDTSLRGLGCDHDHVEVLTPLIRIRNESALRYICAGSEIQGGKTRSSSVVFPIQTVPLFKPVADDARPVPNQ